MKKTLRLSVSTRGKADYLRLGSTSKRLRVCNLGVPTGTGTCMVLPTSTAVFRLNAVVCEGLFSLQDFQTGCNKSAEPVHACLSPGVALSGRTDADFSIATD